MEAAGTHDDIEPGPVDVAPVMGRTDMRDTSFSGDTERGSQEHKEEEADAGAAHRE